MYRSGPLFLLNKPHWRTTRHPVLYSPPLFGYPTIGHGTVREYQLVLTDNATPAQRDKYGADLSIAIFVGLDALARSRGFNLRDPSIIVPNMDVDDVAFVSREIGVPLQRTEVYAGHS